MADFQVLRWAFTVGGVGEEDLVAHALIQVEQGAPGAGMWAFPADDDPRAVRVIGKVDHAGRLGDLGTGAEVAVLLQRGMPDVLGQGADRAADRLGDGIPDREERVHATLAQGAYVVQERFGSSGAVGADEENGAVAAGVGDLGQGRVQDGDVVGGGVGSGVARPQCSVWRRCP
ncbi:hypothetical protein ACIGW0_23455 [Streptomyces bikiniensis]|uniref:Uncharacterized protein n=1 Tax=Streptomyces bikiniensis TaxID=1896 RepID=A0ABW8CXK2_STRBI